MTNTILMLQADTYTIELAPPANYTPPAILGIKLTNTTVLQPYEIRFTKNP